MIREDCKYWQASCELCGITGNETCRRKCKDYDSTADDFSYLDLTDSDLDIGTGD